MKQMKKILFLITSLLLTWNGFSQIRLPAILGDHMVLQRSTQVNLWGWASPAQKMTVTPSWSDKTYTVHTESDGRWHVRIETPQAGGPHTIQLYCGKDSLTLHDILVGEVWICSGQSNMEMPVHGFYGQPVEGSTEALFEASRYPDIRLFTVPPTPKAEPQENCPGQWLTSTPRHVGDFSAVGYFFGKYLHQVLGIPVGLITPNVGGIAIESWMTEESIRATKGIDHELALKPRGDYDAAKAAYLFNGMIAPITRFTARGFIWYQGESNQHNYFDYDKLMASMVQLWRSEWQNDKMPFYYVQLAPYTYDGKDGISLPLTIEAQYRALKLIPHSGIVPTTDLGHPTAIHPPHKKEVGQRLASLALDKTYGIKTLPDPPLVDTVIFTDGKAIVTFHGISDYAPAAWGSFSYFTGDLRGFELAGTDRRFYPAQAQHTKNRNEIVVTCDSVTKPIALRYAFRNWTDANVMTTEGLPLAPFRTDNWNDSY